MIGSALAHRVQASPNHEARVHGTKVELLVLHYTGMASGQSAVEWLCNPASKVSCHYLVDEDGSIVQMVDERRRAWHAGVSQWHGNIDVNSRSIGIEIQNGGHAAGCPPFPDKQMQAVGSLCLDIMMRNALSPRDVVAHSDVAPGRKVDPGEAFNWARLSALGIGCMVMSIGTEKRLLCQRGDEGATVVLLQDMLTSLGYGLDPTGKFDERTRIVLEAFQRHYRPSLINGQLDSETFRLLERLSAIQVPARIVA